MEETNLLSSDTVGISLEESIGPVTSIDLHDDESISENTYAPPVDDGSVRGPGRDQESISKHPTTPRRRSSSLIPPASVKGVIFNLMNAVIGVGVLAMPYCFKRAGILIAPLLLLLVGFLTERSLSLMVRAGEFMRASETQKGLEAGPIGYSATVARCFGPRIGSLSDAFIVIMNFGSAVAYLDVIADIIGAWAGKDSKALGLFFVVLFIIGPLSCVRQIEKLKFTSLLGLSIYAIFGLVTISLFFIGANCSGEVHVPLASGELLVAVPIQTLAFACHTVVFPVYREFKEVPGATTKSFQYALRMTIAICLAMYIVVGFFGALTFKDNILGDILRNYSYEGGGLARFVEGIFAFSICMTYPLLVFPMRDSLDILIMKTKWASSAARNYGWSSERFTTLRFFVLTVVLISFAYLVAVLIPEVEVVFGLTGCTFGTTICFILPSLMFLKATNENDSINLFDSGPYTSQYKKDRQTALGVFATGLTLGLASLVMTLASLGAIEEDSFEALCGNISVVTPSSS